MTPALRAILLGGANQPKLDLLFTSGVLDPRVSASGGASATVINAAGTIVTASAPRFDYSPASLAAQGLLVESTRTNLLLNSLVNGTSLSTQSVTVTAVAHTLSFYGTGTVTLSGVSVAGPLAGAGAYPTRSTLTFTPTAGSLTLTVAGSVQFGQLEVGSFATSFIPTAGAAATRTADAFVESAVTPLPTQGTIIVDYDFGGVDTTLSGGGRYIFSIANAGSSSYNVLGYNQSGNTAGIYSQSDGGVAAGASWTTATTDTAGGAHKIGFAWSANNWWACADGGAVATGTWTNPIGASSSIFFGAGKTPSTSQLNGHIKRARLYNVLKPVSTLRILTTT